MAPEAGERGSRAGLTLVELVVTIVIIGIAATAVLGLLGGSGRGSVDSALRIKTVELAQAYMEEIQAKRWDENTPPGGGCIGVSGGATACTSSVTAECPGSCVPDDSVEDHGDPGRSLLDDVDDYNGLCEGACTDDQCKDGDPPDSDYLRNASGDPRGDRYNGFCVAIQVTSGAGEDLRYVEDDDAKLITLTVHDPQGNAIPFSAYRLNF